MYKLPWSWCFITEEKNKNLVTKTVQLTHDPITDAEREAYQYPSQWKTKQVRRLVWKNLCWLERGQTGALGLASCPRTHSVKHLVQFYRGTNTFCVCGSLRPKAQLWQITLCTIWRLPCLSVRFTWEHSLTVRMCTGTTDLPFRKSEFNVFY